ncbi:MAG TPA: GNAT family N-acetyltransferase [Blastocatellia bacterium]|nr:GNAT family N-acetyltransferase [Blastocatellia bacterium]
MFHLDSSASRQFSVVPPGKYFRRAAMWLEGRELQVRALRWDDRARLKAFLHRCSAASIRARFFRPINEFSEALLNQLLVADGQQHIALVVTQGNGDKEEIIAEGRAVAFQDRPEVGDVAFLVQDDWQKRGIATWLLEELTEIACHNGFTHFTADVLVDNHAMLALIRKKGRPRTSNVSYGVIHYEIPIPCPETAGLMIVA